MTIQIFKHTPLYRFLEYSLLEDKKSVLDCGAGGITPPLSLFKNYGFETTGIEFSQTQLDDANTFSKEENQELNIILGDMTQLAFDDNNFDCVYSYNSVFHMKKNEIKQSIGEMIRVLKPNGLLFVNFLSVDDFRCGEGPHLGNNQYEQMDDEPVIHSYYDFNEADVYFKDLEFVIKETRTIERIFEGNKIKQGFIDYTMRK